MNTLPKLELGDILEFIHNVKYVAVITNIRKNAARKSVELTFISSPNCSSITSIGIGDRLIVSIDSASEDYRKII